MVNVARRPPSVSVSAEQRPTGRTFSCSMLRTMLRGSSGSVIVRADAVTLPALVLPSSPNGSRR